MERKVIQLAGKTLVVSLPSKWAKKFGILKGDTVFVEEKEKELSVRTKKDIDIEKVSLELKGPDEFIKRSVDTAYKKGADELRLNFESPKTRKVVEETLESTMGFEIVSQGSKGCVVKSVAQAVEDEFDSILRRVFLTLIAMAEESHAAASENNAKKLEEIAGYDRTINRLTNFCKRVINKKGSSSAQNPNYMYCIVWEIERIGDKYKEICIAAAGKEKISSDVLGAFREVNGFLRDFYEIYYKFSQEKGIELTKKKNALLKKCKTMLQKKKGADSLVLHNLISIAESVYDIAGPYYAMQL